MKIGTMSDAIHGMLVAAARGLAAAIDEFKSAGIPTTLQYFKLTTSYQWVTEFGATFTESAAISVWVFSLSESLTLTWADKQTFTVTIEAQLVPLSPPK